MCCRYQALIGTVLLLTRLGEATSTVAAELASLAPGGGMDIDLCDSKSLLSVPAQLLVYIFTEALQTLDDCSGSESLKGIENISIPYM